MAASSAVLGCSKIGAVAELSVAPFLLAAPLAENFTGTRDASLLFFIFFRINSRAAPPADVCLLCAARFRLSFDVPDARFMTGNSFCLGMLSRIGPCWKRDALRSRLE